MPFSEKVGQSIRWKNDNEVAIIRWEKSSRMVIIRWKKSSDRTLIHWKFVLYKENAITNFSSRKIRHEKFNMFYNRFFSLWLANTPLLPDFYLHAQSFGNLENVAFHTGLDFQ